MLNVAAVVIIVVIDVVVVVVVVGGKVPPVSRVQRECIIEHKLFSVPKQICSFRSETPDLSGFKFRANSQKLRSGKKNPEAWWMSPTFKKLGSKFRICCPGFFPDLRFSRKLSFKPFFRWKVFRLEKWSTEIRETRFFISKNLNAIKYLNLNSEC